MQQVLPPNSFWVTGKRTSRLYLILNTRIDDDNTVVSMYSPKFKHIKTYTLKKLAELFEPTDVEHQIYLRRKYPSEILVFSDKTFRGMLVDKDKYGITDERYIKNLKVQYDLFLEKMGVLDSEPEKQIAEEKMPKNESRFSSTGDVFSYGIKLGSGKAVQEKAISQFCDALGVDPENEFARTAAKILIPLAGKGAANQLATLKEGKYSGLAQKISDASDGMLLVNTIDTSAAVASGAMDQAAELVSFVLSLYGIDSAEAAKITQDLSEELTSATSEVVNSTIEG